MCVVEDGGASAKRRFHEEEVAGQQCRGEKHVVACAGHRIELDLAADGGRGSHQVMCLQVPLGFPVVPQKVWTLKPPWAGGPRGPPSPAPLPVSGTTLHCAGRQSCVLQRSTPLGLSVLSYKMKKIRAPASKIVVGIK